MAGRDVVTVEGLPDDTRRILSEAFVLEGGVQCGFCIPGIIVRAASLMEHGRTDDRRAVAKALDGHLCRCTGYGRIIDAIQTAGDACKNGGRLPSTEPRRHSYFGEEFGLEPQSGVREATATANGDGIGRSIARHGGLEQALGEKPFVDDMRVPGMLHGAMVLTEHPRARILKIHTEDAAAMPGVVRVFTAADVPGNRGHRPQRSGPAGVRGRRGADVLRRRLSRDGRRRYAVPRAPGRGTGEGRLRGARTDHRPFEALKPDAALVHSADTFAPRPSNVLQPIDRLFSRRRGRGARDLRACD